MVTAAWSNRLNPKHRPNPLFDSTVVLFDEIVQVLARSHSYSTWKFAGLLHLPHCAMRRRVGVLCDLGGCAPVLHRIARKVLAAATSRLRLRKKSTVRPALSTDRYR